MKTKFVFLCHICARLIIYCFFTRWVKTIEWLGYSLSLMHSVFDHIYFQMFVFSVCVSFRIREVKRFSISTWYRHDLWFFFKLLLTLIWSIWMSKQVIVDHLFPFLQHITNIWNTTLSLGDGICLILLLSTVCAGAAHICSALHRWSIFSQQKRAQWYQPAHSRAVRCRYPTLTRTFLFLIPDF